MPKVPDPVLNNIRCANCRKWLSCGPVRLLPNGGSICGRCFNYKQGPRDQYRHFAFEALACYFKFPCKHWERYCPEALPFKKALQHEDRCVYGSACTTFFSHPSAVCKAKRRLDVKSAIKLEVIPDEVLEYLRCGNCAGYLSCTPVYVCRDGTSVCHRCSAQLQQPSPEFIRDPAFETFADMMIFPCIFRYRGCTQYFKFGEQSREHEIECPYGRPYVREQRSRQPEHEVRRQPEHEVRRQPEHEVRRQPEHEVRRQPEHEVRRQESLQQRDYKERGVIKTHSGHIYATITPNAPVFARSTNRQEKDIFLDEFQRHRENLATKWGRPNDGIPQEEFQNPRNSNSRVPGRAVNSPFSPDDDVLKPQQGGINGFYDNMGYASELIDELKCRQQLRMSGTPEYLNNAEGRRGSGMESNDYYNQEREQRKMGYSVYG